MRFKIFGNLDAPDWLLANISLLSKVPSTTVQFVAIAIMNDVVGKSPISMETVFAKLKEIQKAADKKRCVSCLRFIIENTSRFNVENDQFLYELQQIGFTKQTSELIVRTYGKLRSKLVASCQKKTMRLPHLEKVAWRVDYLLASSKVQDINEPSIHFSLDVKNTLNDNKIEKHSFDVSWSKFRVLHHELKQARDKMKLINL